MKCANCNLFIKQAGTDEAWYHHITGTTNTGIVREYKLGLCQNAIRWNNGGPNAENFLMRHQAPKSAPIATPKHPIAQLRDEQDA